MYRDLRCGIVLTWRQKIFKNYQKTSDDRYPNGLVAYCAINVRPRAITSNTRSTISLIVQAVRLRSFTRDEPTDRSDNKTLWRRGRGRGRPAARRVQTMRYRTWRRRISRRGRKWNDCIVVVVILTCTQCPVGGYHNVARRGTRGLLRRS